MNGIESFSSFPGKHYLLHSEDLKTVVKNSINDFPCIIFTD
ncbi:uncharacterized protein METZ01_LOCUS17634 [marine metagenome]|uniref:Uncharacterized protein n=1 Tax=marine metagenome TaxID=408172 RepID=A0A381PCW8_9ZZZZ